MRNAPNVRLQGHSAGLALAILDFENTFMSARRMGVFLRLDDLDDWIHWHYHIVQKVVFLNSGRPANTRNKLIRSGWIIHDSPSDGGPEDDSTQHPPTSRIDSEISLAIYDSYIQSCPDTVLLISGDGEFVPMLKRFRRDERHVELLSFEHSLSKRLARFAERIWDIAKIVDFSASQVSRLDKLISYAFCTDDCGQPLGSDQSADPSSQDVDIELVSGSHHCDQMEGR